jgi:hypothetical protein
VALLLMLANLIAAVLGRLASRGRPGALHAE